MRRPNILIIYTDQQRWDALGANGNPDIQTPNLDQLAKESINFNHCFVQNPVCMPSRISFLSGRYPSSLGITNNGVPVPESTQTFPKLLKPYGYTCANIGKLHFLPHANRDHREPHPDYGFDHLEISDEPGCYEDAYRAWVRNKAPEHLDHISVGLPKKAALWQEMTGFKDGIKHPKERFPKHPIPFRAPDELTHTAFVSERTQEYLREQTNDRPWMCIAGFYSPHSPWVVPQKYLDLYDPDSFTLPEFPDITNEERAKQGYSDSVLKGARHGYYAMVSEVDEHVGRILESLESSGHADNTIVVFTSDHGDFLGEQLRWGKGHPAPDCVSRVPLMIRFPKGIGCNQGTNNSIVEAIDVLPTLLECADIPVPNEIQGESLKPLVTNEEQFIRDSALMESTGWKSLRTERYRYIIDNEGKECLFDLQQLHGEYRDLSSEVGYKNVLSELRHEMLQRLVDHERPLPRTWAF